MDPHQLHDPAHATHAPLMKRLLGLMSAVTMAMTIPQVWIIWVNHEAAGVSLLSWSTYFFSALLWFGHGLREHDRNIYLACIGWLILDAAVIAGVLRYA